MCQMAVRAVNLPTWDPENDRHFLGLISKHPAIWKEATPAAQELAWTKIKEDEIVGKFSIDVLKERWQMLYTNFEDEFNNFRTRCNADRFNFLLSNAAQSSESISTDAPERARSSSPLPTPEEAASARATAAVVSAKIIKLMETYYTFGLANVAEIIKALDDAQVDAEVSVRRRLAWERGQLDLVVPRFRTVSQRVVIRLRSQQRENQMR